MPIKKKTSKKKTSKKASTKKTAKKKSVTKKKVAKKSTKKTVKKKSSVKKATKKKANKKSAAKKTTKKKSVAKKKVAKKSTKKTVKKKTSAKKATKKKISKKSAAKKVTKKAGKKSSVKKVIKKKVSSAKAAINKSIKKINKVKKAQPATSGQQSSPELKVYKPKVSVGGSVPEFSLPATGGQSISASSLRGQKAVIYFYPKDATPGCTIEGHDFTRLKDSFAQMNTVVYGVSRDSMKSHEKFKTKQDYKIDLISDENEELCAIFGAIKIKNMYGRMVRGINRSTFVIDENGQLIKEWRSVKVKGHADEVLAYIQSV